MEQEQKRVSLEEFRPLADAGRTKCCEVPFRNEVPSYKIGKLHGIRRSDVERWLEANRAASGDR